jgi:phage-related protein
MEPYFTFGSTTSTSVGVEVQEYPAIVRPKARVETKMVPGRSGELLLHEAETVYEPYDREMVCRLLPTATLTTVAAWLKGSGTLVLGNEPTYAYTARVDEAIDFEKILANHADRRFKVTFRCQPWKELASPGADITLSTNPQNIVSTATLPSMPYITVAGTGDVTVTVGTLYSFILDDMAAGTPLVVDCDSMIVSGVGGAGNYTYKMTGSFPRLWYGTNAVSHTGTVTSVVIKPRYRWL